ncbi:type II secretion system F family protein [Microlunatus elymi]|uniref:Type II secretion system F family protein n=1 Tax=Microlunatus elymi TaxID=2596828 RepID=A0A516PZL7_9ACTN|nr:type II secretion system F family protein [Microlunatus elymi]QDP96619.1 type II secretion system F family protein [Microlunatus elymi]
MTAVSALWPALGFTAAVLVFILGLRLVRSRPADYLDADDLILLRDERRRANRRSPLDLLADPLVPALRRLLGRRGVGYLRRMIDQAGRPEGVTVDRLIRRVAWWIVLMIPVGIMFMINGQWLALPLLPVIVVVVPLMGIAGSARRRREAVDRELPDFLDILAVTVSAGIAFRAALRRVTDRFSGPIAEEVGLTLDQMSHGASLRVAFSGLQERTGSESMRTFVTAFLQAEELGAPLIDTLNQIALDMRRTSAQQARRRAAQIAPRVTLVTSLLMVPAALILLVVGIVVGADIDFGSLFKAFS